MIQHTLIYTLRLSSSNQRHHTSSIWTVPGQRSNTLRSIRSGLHPVIRDITHPLSGDELVNDPTYFDLYAQACIEQSATSHILYLETSWSMIQRTSIYRLRFTSSNQRYHTSSIWRQAGQRSNALRSIRSGLHAVIRDITHPLSGQCLVNDPTHFGLYAQVCIQ
jgi:hypothetical protein